MREGIEKILSFGLWYGIFCFVTGEIDPMAWSTAAKVFAVIVALILISKD
jgi:hypothetical protein